MKKAYQGTRNSINKGIANVKDPEFRTGVKESFSKGLNTMKTKTENVMQSVSNRFIDPPPQNLNRDNYQNLDQNNQEHDSPFNVMSDDEEQDFTQVNQINNKKKQEDNLSKDNLNEKNIKIDDDEEEDNIPLISEVNPKKIEQITPEPLDKIN